MGKIKMGYMKLVKNSNPRPNASESYVALWVEDEDGKNERCLMFRKSVVSKLPCFALPDSLGVEEKMKLGRLYEASSGVLRFYIVKISDLDGVKKIVKLTQKKVATAKEISSLNVEDIPERGLINDLID